MIQEPISTEEIHLQGIPVSPGIALGKIRIQIKGSKEPVAYDIEPDEVDSELVRFHRALQTTAVQIRALRERMIQISGEKEAAIFDAHILLLQDKIILDQVRTELARRLQNVEHIFYVVMQNYMEVLRRVDDPYLRAKTADMEDIMQRVIDNLRSTEPPEEDEADEEEPEILVAYDLTPSDTAAVDASQIHGFATEIGSSVSHTAILARSMGIPAVVGLEQALLNVESHAPAILDGYKGVHGDRGILQAAPGGEGKGVQGPGSPAGPAHRHPGRPQHPALRQRGIPPRILRHQGSGRGRRRAVPHGVLPAGQSIRHAG